MTGGDYAPMAAQTFWSGTPRRLTYHFVHDGTAQAGAGRLTAVSAQFQQVRQQVLRRVRYATNTIALRDNRLPPEGPYDAGLTNALLSIVTYEWPGEEVTPKGKMKCARDLLDVLDRHDNPFPYIDTAVLREGLDLTQPARHGRSDDEFAVLRPNHVAALVALDDHPALYFLDAASTERDVGRLIWLAFVQRAEVELPFDPKDRSIDAGDPEDCDECCRPTFLPSGWDTFGGIAGHCIACGYSRDYDAAYDRAVQTAFRARVSGWAWVPTKNGWVLSSSTPRVTVPAARR